MSAGASTAVRPPTGLWRDAWRRLAKNRADTVSLWVFAGIVLACGVGPLIGGWLGIDATAINTDIAGKGPSSSHWFGTDTLGRDMLMRTLTGGRIAIAVAVLSTIVALIIGVSWGAVAAYAGGRIDFVMMRIVDVLYGFPTVAFVIVIMAVLGTNSLLVLFALIGGISWLTMARIARGAVLTLRNREFVEAARAIGVRPLRILFRHILPNASGPIIIYATLALPAVMLTEAFLSFLGLGVQAPLASWGTLVTEGSSQILVYPWLLLFPALVEQTQRHTLSRPYHCHCVTSSNLPI